MIYFGSFFAGIINGLFASGAGQILVFILIFVLKQDAYKSRKLSVFVMGVTSLLTLIRYLKNIDVSVRNVLIVGIIGVLLGGLGNKTMKKVEGNLLNFCSGGIIVILTVIKMLRSGI